MKNLNQKQWIAVIVAIAVVGFFFLFGQSVISFFNHLSLTTMNTGPQIQSVDTVVGTGDIAQSGDLVTVNYVGTFTNGTTFDSSVARNEPFQFMLGKGQVISGWDQGVVGMRVGGTRNLTIPPELGYGPKDYGPIPGGSTLLFQVQLLKVVHPAPASTTVQ